MARFTGDSTVPALVASRGGTAATTKLRPRHPTRRVATPCSPARFVIDPIQISDIVCHPKRCTETRDNAQFASCEPASDAVALALGNVESTNRGWDTETQAGRHGRCELARTRTPVASAGLCGEARGCCPVR